MDREKRRVIPFRPRRSGSPPPDTPTTEPDSRHARYAAGRPGADETPWNGPAIDQVRVMVVEHDTAVRDDVVTTLQQWGAHVASFGSAADATGEIEACAPDVLIVALRAPGDPYRLLAAARRHISQRRRHMPVIAICADAIDRRRAASAGIHLCVTRPVDHARLRLAIANLARAA
jgi:CheY-like chemotaxis protein